MLKEDPSHGIPAARRGLPKLSLKSLWPMAVLVGVFVLVGTYPIRPHDFWWHLKAGQEIVLSGRIPSVDTFSHTMVGTPYNNYAAFWLMEVAYYFLYTAGGPALVAFFHSLLVTAAYALLLWLCFRVSRNWRVAAAATFFAVALGFGNWNVRPQAIAFVAGVVVLSVIYEYRARPRRWLLMLPPITLLVWANGHGSFVVGLLMLGLWLADEVLVAVQSRFIHHAGWRLDRIWPPALMLLLASSACLVNPRGFGAIRYVLDLSSNPVIRNLVPEWAPPSFADWSGSVFLLGLLLCAVILAVSPRRPSRFQILTFVTFGVLALSSTRSEIWFGIVMAPVLADHLGALFGAQTATRSGRPGTGEHQGLNYLFAAILLAGVLLVLPWFKHLLPLPLRKAGLISHETPVAATQVLLQEHPPGPIFNELSFGSYLIWAAQPDYPVFADTRLELYPLEFWRDYLDISAAREGWQDSLSHYGVNTLMLSLAQQPNLIAAVRRSPDWRFIYEDGVAAIFARVPRQQ
jgi:hypothetical protein